MSNVRYIPVTSREIPGGPKLVSFPFSTDQKIKDYLINKLTKTERAIVVLYYYKNKTIEEIAETLGISENKVSQIQASIIARLSTLPK